MLVLVSTKDYSGRENNYKVQKVNLEISIFDIFNQIHRTGQFEYQAV